MFLMIAFLLLLNSANHKTQQQQKIDKTKSTF